MPSSHSWHHGVEHLGEMDHKLLVPVLVLTRASGISKRSPDEASHAACAADISQRESVELYEWLQTGSYSNPLINHNFDFSSQRTACLRGNEWRCPLLSPEPLRGWPYRVTDLGDKTCDDNKRILAALNSGYVELPVSETLNPKQNVLGRPPGSPRNIHPRLAHSPGLRRKEPLL